MAAVVTAAGLLMIGGPAGADSLSGAATPSPDAQYYRSSVSAIEPAVPGLAVEVVADGQSLSLENRSDREVVVLGLAGEPYLRFTSKGVDENVTALSAELNAGRAPRMDPGKQVVTWTHRTDEPKYVWRDVRVQWMPKQRPPIVAADEHAQHRVLDWALPLTADGKPVLVRGAVDWTGTPRFGTVTYVLVGAAALLGIWAAFRLRRRTRSKSAPGVDFDEEPQSVLVGALPDLAELAVKTGRTGPSGPYDSYRSDGGHSPDGPSGQAPADPYAAFRPGGPATAPTELPRRAARRTR